MIQIVRPFLPITQTYAKDPEGIFLDSKLLPRLCAKYLPKKRQHTLDGVSQYQDEKTKLRDECELRAYIVQNARCS